jgi:catabolite regulation protein CreA
MAAVVAAGGDETSGTTAMLTSLVGETVTLSEVLGGTGDYTASFACSGATNSPVYTPGDTSATLLIDAADTAITCTYTNSINVAGITLQKAWLGAVASDTADLTIAATNGPIMATSTATGGDQTDLVNVALLSDALVGETVTLSEVLAGTGDYSTDFSCTGAANAPTYTPGATSATLLVDAADTSVTCTFTNTINTAELTLQKTWVGAVAADTADLTADGANGPVMAAVVAAGGDETSGTTAMLTSLVGETVTLSEVLGGTGVYATDFVCTGNTNAPTYTPGATSATLLIDAADTAITCTYTNTIQTAELTLQKTWVGAVAADTADLTADGANGPVMAAVVATGGDETSGTTAMLTSLVGETVTLSEVLGGIGVYTTDFACTGATNAPTYTPGATSATLLIDAADTAITCTYTNTIGEANVTLQKEWIGGVAADTADLTADGANGPVMAQAVAAGGDEISATTAILSALVGETVDLSEVLGGKGVYTTSFACTGASNAPTYVAGTTSATLLIDAADATIVCTFTNRSEAMPPVIVEPIAVPVNDKLALLLLTLMMLATGWYFRPATVRKY